MPFLCRFAIVWIAAVIPVTHLASQNPGAFHRYDAAIAHFQENGLLDSFRYYSLQKARMARQAGNLEQWAWVQLDVHDLASDAPETAIKTLDDALAQQWRLPADSAESEPFMYIQAYRGYYLSAIGRIWQAVQAYETAAAFFERYHYADPDFEVVEMVYKPLGNHYTRLGDNEKALAVFQKALQATAAGNTAELGGLYNNIGIAHWNRGDLAAAEVSYRRGLGLPDLPAQKRALLLTGLAQTRLDGGQPGLARQSASTALRLLNALAQDQTTLEYRAYARRTAGVACSRIRQYGNAARFLQAALSDAVRAFGVSTREAGKTSLALSELFLLENRPVQALEAANRALTAVLPSFQPGQLQDNPPVSSFYPENTIFEALFAKAAAAEGQYRHSGDIQWLRVALDCHDKARQAESMLRSVFQYRSSKIDLQNNARIREEAAMDIARLLYEKTGEAVFAEKGLAIAERSKAALLLDALQDNLIRQRLAGSDKRLDSLTALRQSAAYFERNLLLQPQSKQAQQWRAELDALQGLIAGLERAIDQSYPGLAGYFRALDLPQDALPKGETPVEYFVSPASVDVFIGVDSRPLIWHRLQNDSSLQALVHQFLFYFEDAGAILAGPAAYLQTAYAVWQKIVPPEMAAAQRLVIVPDGFLNFIPFEALVNRHVEGETSLRGAAYLIRRQEIRYAWSLAALRQQDALLSGVNSFLLGVAPLFAHGERGLPPLNSGVAEWETLPAGSAEELIGPAASMAQFLSKAGNYRVLHLSTHAHADRRDSLPPLIELYDASLTLPDIYALPLHADLVVLSACQTGLGAEQKGEGVMSLARAFAQAGAACIVSSLWSVNDRSNVRLFQDFYRLCSGGQSTAGALRSAKLSYLDDNNIPATSQSPYFWAGVVAVGVNRSLHIPAPAGNWYAWVGFVLLAFGMWWWFRRKSP